MTEYERKMLTEAHRMSQDLHRAFMERSPSGEPPLIERMSGVVIVVERSNWAARMLIRAFLTLGGLAGAAAAIVAIRGGK